MRRSLFLLLTIAALAQAAPEVEITAEPHHHLAFSNDQVRVFNAEVPPQSETLPHRHRHDYVYVALGASEVSNTLVGKDPVTGKLADGEAGFVSGNFAHTTRNLSDRPFRIVVIELLQDDKLRPAHATRDAADTEKSRGLEILHRGTEEILWVHDGVRASLFELQPGGEALISESPQLLVPVTDLHLFGKGPPNSPHHMAMDIDRTTGDALWISARSSRTLANSTTAVARFVTLEFP